MRVPQSYPNGGCWIVKVHKGVGVLGKLWQDLVSDTVTEWHSPAPSLCPPTCSSCDCDRVTGLTRPSLTATRTLWLLLQCFGAIGEFFDDLSVVGVSMASRPHWDNLSVWTRDTISTEAKFRIG